MMKKHRIPATAFFCLFLLCAGKGFTQHHLDKRISFSAREQRLDDILSIIGNHAGFNFSYNSNIVKRDSLVTMTVENRTVRQVLNELFNGRYEYKESGNYIILRRVSLQLTTVTKTTPSTDRSYTISGYVVNSETGERVADVSIYETEHLTSTLTDANGNFSIRLKDRYRTNSLAISKDAFEDTVVSVPQKYNLQLVIAIVPSITETVVSAPNTFQTADTAVNMVAQDTVARRPVSSIEETSFGRFLLSAKQKIRSLNMKKFFTEKPFQFSVIPGVSTQSKMSGQVINNFSFNLFGGYTGGVKGIEIGGLFNLNKKDVKYVQAAGLFNITGGSVTGLQVAGLHNNSLENLKGLQVAGINNYVKGDVGGAQLAGVANINGGMMDGLQLAGVFNYHNRRSNSLQIAGVANMGGGEVKGLQFAGIFNYAKKLKGIQIGLINISDTSEGYSIGLVNVVLKGYHKLSLYTTESVNANVAFKTGSRRLYSILQAGLDVGRDEEKLYTFGYGLGTEQRLARWLSLNPEITSQYLYLGSWDYLNLLNKLHLQFNIQIAKRFSVFGGPSFAVYYSNQLAAVDGYKHQVLPTSYHSFQLGNPRVRGWFGWNAGINIF